MRALWVVLGLGVAATCAEAQSTPRQDALVAGYFAIWDDDANVSFDNVEKLYAPRVTYYGHPMTRDALYRDKLAFIRRWPERRYAVEPGSAAKTCDAGEARYVITATLAWHTRGAGGTRAGRSRVSLTLARADGGLKIVREGGVTLSR